MVNSHEGEMPVSFFLMLLKMNDFDIFYINLYLY